MSFIGELGRGKPTMMPGQSMSGLRSIMDLAGMGVRKGFRNRLLDNASNVSPTENAGNASSTPTAKSIAPATPKPLATMPNINGMALPPSFNNVGIPMPSSMETVAPRPSQVGTLQSYKAKLGGVKNPGQVASQAVQNRTGKGKVLDTVLGLLQGFGQGGILGGVGGAVGGYRGVPRYQQTLEQATQEANAERQRIMDEYNIDNAIVQQSNAEEDDLYKRQKLAYDQDQNIRQQEVEQAKAQRQVMIDELDMKYKMGTLTQQEKRLYLDLAKEMRGMGPLPENVTSGLGLPTGTALPKEYKPKWTQVTDQQGNVTWVDTNSETPPPAMNIGAKLPPIDKDIILAEVEQQLLNEYLQKYPGGFIDNPKYTQADRQGQYGVLFDIPGEVRDAKIDIRELPEYKEQLKRRYNERYNQEYTKRYPGQRTGEATTSTTTGNIDPDSAPVTTSVSPSANPSNTVKMDEARLQYNRLSQAVAERPELNTPRTQEILAKLKTASGIQ